MKRITAVAAAVLALSAAVSLASAQGKFGKGPAVKVEKTVKVELVKEAPSPSPTPPPVYDTTPHTKWSSGELQTQIGSKNKDKKKLVMQVWCEYRHDGPTTYSWQVKYTLKAENKNLVGSGWHEVGDLYALDYNITYTAGGGSPVTKSGYINLSGQSRVDGVVASGSNAPAPPTFTTNHFTGKRGGGSSGINLAWP